MEDVGIGQRQDASRGHGASSRRVGVSRWRHLTRDEMDGYNFEMLERTVGDRWAQVVYDYGMAEHPLGEEPSMENIGEFVDLYPSGYYWTGIIIGEATQEYAHGGPHETLISAKKAADRWLEDQA